MTETLRVLVAAGLLMPLLLLRLSAEEFGAAEYDETRTDWTPGLLRRLSWYGLGIALVAVVYFVYPRPRDHLGLVTGRSSDVVVYGILFAALGTAQAALFAFYRYRDFRLPAARAYPGAVVNAMATAFIDEATFRGILLGFMLTAGAKDWVAILVQAIVYALCTRTGAKGRHPYMLLLTLAIGVAGGYATVQTGGIGAAVFAHVVTRFALFVTTGHAGQVTRRGREPEEVERVRRAPAGWEAATAPSQRGMPEPRGISEMSSRAPSAERATRRARNAEDAADAEGGDQTEWWTADELAASTAGGGAGGTGGGAGGTRARTSGGGPATSGGPSPDADPGDPGSSPRRNRPPRGDRSGGAGPR